MCDNGGQKYKQFVEDIIQNRYAWFYKELQISLENNDWVQNKYKAILNYGDFPRKPAHYVDRYDKVRYFLSRMCCNFLCNTYM